MKRMAWGAVLAISATALLAGCSSPTPGQAQASPTGQTTTSTVTQDGPTSSGSPSPAPKVTKPLDASKMVANPCSALTPDDVTSLRITKPLTKATTDATGSDCGWTGESGGTIGISWVTANTSGLSDLYAKASTIAYWQPVTVDGYPAAFGDSIKDERPQGVCALNVAVNDHLYFFSQFVNPSNAGQSCELARQAASYVLKNLGSS
ncbi:DUF3558 domain-containing protein [Actinocrispum wychmicini]|uniref:Uncharacterized protein DUF3558 n=1 Tax=Actinocrispum wychmicini TaxID=1213861 RepID=A0A4R2JV62_9PSEU|nr:DUF3558 domain-containing protein [Actinocrispum wychmicini]TCO62932.1 uncharacterized protein DUF3558 [Actinocrispum wychmicini]